MIRELDWYKLSETFQQGFPFRHIVIDNFFIPEIAEKLSEEFPDYNSDYIHHYSNAIEDKKVYNHWDKFPSCTYRAFSYFGSNDFMQGMSILTNDNGIVFDFGLNGGGWHMHGRGGNNNVHLDYNLHPKLGMQRKLNIIVYLTKDWNPAWNGGLELWSHDPQNNQPLNCESMVDNVFNRAIIFDTTENSWHGLPKYIECPEGVVRKSIAAYFLIPAPGVTENRGKALFAPREDQKNDQAVIDLIKMRSDVTQSKNVYRS
jgi:hypothetical protein